MAAAAASAAAAAAALRESSASLRMGTAEALEGCAAEVGEIFGQLLKEVATRTQLNEDHRKASEVSESSACVSRSVDTTMHRLPFLVVIRSRRHLPNSLKMRQDNSTMTADSVTG